MPSSSLVDAKSFAPLVVGQNLFRKTYAFVKCDVGLSYCRTRKCRTTEDSPDKVCVNENVHKRGSLQYSDTS